MIRWFDFISMWNSGFRRVRNDRCISIPDSCPEFVDGILNGFPGRPGTLLDAAQQFLLLSLDILKIIICKLRPLLLELSTDDVPVAFDFEFIHMILP